MAHRLMDYGFHAPTLSFPVHDTLMVEPTESESKEEMDRFCDALVEILKEAQSVPALVVNAPYTAAEVVGEWAHEFSREQAVYPLEWVRVQKFFPHVTKIDNGYGDRNLVAVNEE